MQAEGELLATLSPPFHLPGSGSGSGPGTTGGLTILMCMVSNILHGELEVAWILQGTGRPQPASYNLMRNEDGTLTAMSVISVASSDWDSYICFVSHRRLAKVTQTRYVGFPNNTRGESPCRTWMLQKPFSRIYYEIVTMGKSVLRFKTRV